jgi:transcriptional regulator of acetoin/glycerol metabolism
LQLVRHFLRAVGDFEITSDCAEALLAYRWPYNVRELEQLLAPLVSTVAQRGTLELLDLPERVRAPLDSRLPRAPASDLSSNPLLSVRRDATPTADELRTVVEAHAGNVAQVASFFRKDRRQIYRWAQALGLDIQALRGAVPEPEHRTLPAPTSPVANALSAAPAAARTVAVVRPRRDSDEVDPLAFD